MTSLKYTFAHLVQPLAHHNSHSLCHRFPVYQLLFSRPPSPACCESRTGRMSRLEVCFDSLPLRFVIIVTQLSFLRHRSTEHATKDLSSVYYSQLCIKAEAIGLCLMNLDCTPPKYPQPLNLWLLTIEDRAAWLRSVQVPKSGQSQSVLTPLDMSANWGLSIPCACPRGTTAHPHTSTKQTVSSYKSQVLRK